MGKISSENLNIQREICNIKVLGKNGATSFSRNVISSNRRFAEMQFCRIVVLLKKMTENDFRLNDVSLK